MTFQIVNTKSGKSPDNGPINTKGNLRIDYKLNNSKTLNSVYTYDGKTTITSNNEQDSTLRMNVDSYNILLAITGNDMVLEQRDLDNIDKVHAEYKNVIKNLNKKLDEGEVTIEFTNGDSITIDFETDEEQKASDIYRGYKAPYGTKKEYYRKDLINKYKDKYNIVKEVHTNENGEKYAIYKITAKKDVNLSRLTSDLGIDINTIQETNDGYGKYDYNGHFIGNKPMMNNTIQIPVGNLGYEFDERGFFERLFN